jgi:putative transposase
MVVHPAEYRWSSYRANAQGDADAQIQPHDVYRAAWMRQGGVS